MPEKKLVIFNIYIKAIRLKFNVLTRLWLDIVLISAKYT